MNTRIIALGLAISMVSTIMLPASVSASYDATKLHHSSHSMNFFHTHLLDSGYIPKDAKIAEKIHGIIRFQKENNLRQTGTMSIETRQAIRGMLNLSSIAETAIATPILSTLVAAVQAGGLVDTLATGGPFTVFAPTNDAFAKIPSDTLNTLLTPAKKSDLVSILTYHVVSGKALSSDLRDGQEIKTLQ